MENPTNEEGVYMPESGAIDHRQLAYWQERGELLPEVKEMSADLLEELVDSVGYPPELNGAIRDLIFSKQG